jgi:carboxypeptidase PM20D1
MSRFMKVALFAAALAVVVVLFRAFTIGLTPAPPAERITFSIDEASAVGRFQEALRFRTISTQDGSVDTSAFLGLHEFLRTAFPLVHQHLSREVLDLSLIYRWPGRDPKKAAVVLMGHLDVVPIAPGTEGSWTHPPFDAVIDGDWIYGRGTLDDKSTVMAVLESIEHLLKEGFTPERTVVLQFGHDEEVGGVKGAKAMVEKLVGEGLHPGLVLDEGGALTSAKVIGASGLAALIGVGEKGFASFSLSVAGDGGHSSTPPAITHIGRLARAIVALEKSPFTATLDGVPREMLERSAPHLSWSRRLILANLWLFRPLVTQALLTDPRTASMLRTSTAATIFNAGNKDNVLPPEARAIVNFRIRPGETVESVRQRVVRLIADDLVEVKVEGFRSEPPPYSPTHGPAFDVVGLSARQTLGDGGTEPIVLPFLLMGATDARYWSVHAKAVYRFNPFPMEDDALKRAHGTNERVSKAGYINGIRFYVQLIKNSQSLD